MNECLVVGEHRDAELVDVARSSGSATWTGSEIDSPLISLPVMPGRRAARI